MIISKMRGGLGNQLFEWAAGVSLARMLATTHLIDLEVYTRNDARSFDLKNMGVAVIEARSSDVERLKKCNFYKQPHYHFDSGFYNLPDNTYLRGYFCSERYFDSSKTYIREILWRALDSLYLNIEQVRLLTSINSESSVSLHIRRGDYVSNPGYNEFFGTCDTSYYQNAIAAVSERLATKDFTLFVFSDDLPWCRENIHATQRTVFADTNFHKPGFYDLMFMAKCKHNIIANSTFSWWSAWLNMNPEKIVVAPKNWFRTHYREKSRGAWIADPNYRLDDLFPKNWVSI